MAEVVLTESEGEQTDLAMEAQEASKVPLPTGDSSSITSDGGSEVLRLWELEMEEKRSKRDDRRAMLELEVKKAALEAEERKAAREAEAEERKAAWEAEIRKVKLEAEKRMAEWDDRMRLEQAKLDHEIRMLELKAQQTRLGEDEETTVTPRPSLGGWVIWRSKPSALGTL